jgi:hypothetical protein
MVYLTCRGVQLNVINENFLSIVLPASWSVVGGCTMAVEEFMRGSFSTVLRWRGRPVEPLAEGFVFDDSGSSADADADLSLGVFEGGTLRTFFRPLGISSDELELLEMTDLGLWSRANSGISSSASSESTCAVGGGDGGAGTSSAGWLLFSPPFVVLLVEAGAGKSGIISGKKINKLNEK